VLISRGSRLAGAPAGFGRTMSGSRNQATRLSSRSTSSPWSFRCAWSCLQTSSLTSSRVRHSIAFFPFSPGVSQSEMSTESTPPTPPSPYFSMGKSGQNWCWEMDVKAQGESM